MNWQKLITGILMMGALVWIYSSSRAGIDEANNIRLHGWYYVGTTQVSSEQADYLIKKYQGFHSGEVNVIETNPITIQYDFATMETIPYLTQIPMNGWDKSAAAIGGDVIIVMFLIPIMIIFSALPIGNNRDDRNIITKGKTDWIDENKKEN